MGGGRAGTGPGRCPDYAHPQSRPLGRAPSGEGGPAPTQCPGPPWAGRLRGKTAGKPGPPCRAFCPGLRDWKMALLWGTVRWPRSVGLQRARASPGAPGPRGPTSRPEGVPGSHHHSHEAGPSKHGLGLGLCSWDGDREPGSPDTHGPGVQEVHGGLGRGRRAVAKGPGVAQQREPTGKALTAHRTCVRNSEPPSVSPGSRV